ncbi:MAG: prolipoprotein diacylglyceryl transferase [Dehalococcoidia bacterium]
MIDIGIDPILISLGFLSISWHALLTAIAVAVGVWLVARLVLRAGLSLDILYAGALWAILGGIVGARLVHVIDYWSFYSANPGAIMSFWEGGLAIWGAILGGTLTTLIFARVRRLPFAPYADCAALGLILAQAVGRIGDVINGEHISRATTLPWGVVYTHPDSPGYGLSPSHPAVAYELLMDLLIFGVLWKLRGRIRPDGALFLLYLTAYSTGRFLLSFLRLDSNTVLLGLNQPQWISLMVIAIALPFLLLQLVRRREKVVES